MYWKLILLMLLASNAFADINTGLISWYKMDESSGSAIDSKGVLNINAISEPASVPAKKYLARSLSSGVQFRSTTVAGTALNISGSSVTIAFWQYPTAVGTTLHGSSQVSVGNGVRNDGNYEVMLTGTGTGIFFRTNNTSPTSITSVASTNLNQWSHIVCTYDGSTKKIYINGVLDNSIASSGALVADSVNFNMGTRQNTAGTYTGYLDDVRIYNRALTAADVLELYNSSTVIRNATLNNFTINP